MRRLGWLVLILAISLPGFSPRASADLMFSSEFSSAAQDSLAGVLASLKKEYPDDFAHYSKGFWDVRQVCAEMARIRKTPSRSSKTDVFSVSTYGSDLYTRQARKMLPKMLSKRIGELRENVAAEFSRDFCPAMNMAIFQKAEYDLFNLAVDNLAEDIRAGKYAKCRDDIDREIGGK